MIYCTVLTGSGREQARTFIQATCRHVCLPELAGSVLAVSVERPAHMQVTIEEEVILSVDVTPEIKHFDLTSLLTRKPKPPKRGLLASLRRTTEIVEQDPGPAKQFTVRFFDGKSATDRLFATYEFHLLDAAVYQTRFKKRFDLVEGEVVPAKFTTDARSPATAKDCWNCDAPVRAGGTCRSCGKSQVHDDDHEH